DGGEPDMRMRAHIEPTAGVEFRRTEMVKKDKRPNHSGARRRQGTTYREVAEIDRARYDHLSDGIALKGITSFRIFTGKEAHCRTLLSSVRAPRTGATRYPWRYGRLLLWKLRQPSAIFPEYSIVAEPALVEPGIGTQQEAVRMAVEQAAPFGAQLSVAGR